MSAHHTPQGIRTQHSHGKQRTKTQTHPRVHHAPETEHHSRHGGTEIHEDWVLAADSSPLVREIETSWIGVAVLAAAFMVQHRHKPRDQGHVCGGHVDCERVRGVHAGQT